jgi:hypothetical protein
LIIMVAPQGLSAASRRLWRQVTDELELSSDALLIFEALLRTSDELAQLEKLAAEVLEAGEAFHENNAGNIRPHPAFEEVRRHRAQLEKHAAALNLPHLLGDSSIRTPHKPPSAASKHAQKAAQARWGTGGHTAS